MDAQAIIEQIKLAGLDAYIVGGSTPPDIIVLGGTAITYEYDMSGRKHTQVSDSFVLYSKDEYWFVQTRFHNIPIPIRIASDAAVVIQSVIDFYQLKTKTVNLNDLNETFWILLKHGLVVEMANNTAIHIRRVSVPPNKKDFIAFMRLCVQHEVIDNAMQLRLTQDGWLVQIDGAQCMLEKTPQEAAVKIISLLTS